MLGKHDFLVLMQGHFGGFLLDMESTFKRKKHFFVFRYTTAVNWLKYCRYSKKKKKTPINQWDKILVYRCTLKFKLVDTGREYHAQYSNEVLHALSLKFLSFFIVNSYTCTMPKSISLSLLKFQESDKILGENKLLILLNEFLTK